MRPDSFAEKLRLVLKALVLSRTGLASALNADKSLVGRWAAGSVIPSEHNLAKLTRFVAGHVDGFTMLDWDRSTAEFAAVLGVSAPGAAPDWIPAQVMDEARRGARQRGWAYEGLWRSTRRRAICPAGSCATSPRSGTSPRTRSGSAAASRACAIGAPP